MEAETTPGPWEIIRLGKNVYVEAVNKGGFVCDMQLAEIDAVEHPVALADARLIAAAPELLEALEGLLANAPAPKGIKKDYSYILYREAARRAIAKAKPL